MKKLLILLVSVLLLCGCTPQISDYTLSTVTSSPETTVPPTETTQAKEYREYATYPVEHPTDNVSGNVWYEDNALVVSCYDTDLRRKVVLCSQPSCTHNNRDCPAFLGGGIGTVYVVRGDIAYALIDDSEKSGEITFVSQNLVTGQRSVLWDLTPEENVVRQRFQLSIDGSTAFLSFEQYTMVLQELNYSYENYRNYGYAINLNTGDRELVINSEITVLDYIQLVATSFWFRDALSSIYWLWSLCLHFYPWISVNTWNRIPPGITMPIFRKIRHRAMRKSSVSIGLPVKRQRSAIT